MKEHLLKMATIVSSVLLVSGFVCYRAGAFNWLMAHTTIMSGTKSTFNTVEMQLGAPAAQSETPASTQPAPFIFKGTKSLGGFDTVIDATPKAPPTSETPNTPPSPAPQQAPPVNAPPAPTILPSSKSGAVLFIPPFVPFKDPAPNNAPPVPPPQTQVAPPQGGPKPAPAKPVIMSGTKSEEIFSPNRPVPSKPVEK